MDSSGYREELQDMTGRTLPASPYGTCLRWIEFEELVASFGLDINRGGCHCFHNKKGRSVTPGERPRRTKEADAKNSAKVWAVYLEFDVPDAPEDVALGKGMRDVWVLSSHGL